MNQERINELYSGNISDHETQKTIRERIHWICSQAVGKKVLDLGCSQGIVCLILGKEGFECVGIDTDETAIKYARAVLSRETKLTQERVDFQLSDVSQLSFEDAYFDTVILRDNLENLTQPEKVLSEARRVIKEGGRIIITVPIGLNPSTNYKRIYYPSSFLELVQSYFNLISVDTLNDYIIYSGEKVSSTDTSSRPREALLLEYLRLQKQVEERCLLKEEKLLETSLQLNKKIENLNEKISSLSELNLDLEKARSELKDVLAARDNELEKLVNLLAGRDGKIIELNNVLGYQEQMFKTSWRWRIGSMFIDGYQMVKKVLSAPIRFIKQSMGRVKVKPPDSAPILDQSEDESVSQVSPSHDTAVNIFPPLGIYSQISESNVNGRTAKKDEISLGCILDEFTAACFDPECRLIRFRPDNWQEVLEKEPPKVIFVESTWRGNEGSWQYRIAKYSVNLGDELFHLLAWANAKKIPSIFWNKEDPPHYDRFIEKAKLFDYVFTSDANCIERYVGELGHKRVFALPFAAQPLIHNPIKDHQREIKACFAGTYYGDTYPERKQDMEHLLKPALSFGLDIYDRQFGLTGPYADTFRFPEIYQPAVKGRLDYEEMIQAYKKYLVFLNVNSIKSSPTMFSRRVFELLASGTPVISTYSKGIEEMLGNDLVLITESEADTKKHLENLLDDDYWSKLSVKGIRKVMGKHTYNHRLKYVLAHCGLKLSPSNLPFFTVISLVEDVHDIEDLSDSLARQIYQDFEVVLLSENELESQAIQRLRNTLSGKRIEYIPHYLEKQFYNQLLSAKGDYFAILKNNDYYGDNYLKDHALAVVYASECDFFGKSSYYMQSQGKQKLQNPGYEFKFVSQVPTATLMVRKERFDGENLPIFLATNTFQIKKNKILSLDRFNYIQVESSQSLLPRVIDSINI